MYGLWHVSHTILPHAAGIRERDASPLQGYPVGTQDKAQSSSLPLDESGDGQEPIAKPNAASVSRLEAAPAQADSRAIRIGRADHKISHNRDPRCHNWLTGRPISYDYGIIPRAGCLNGSSRMSSG